MDHDTLASAISLASVYHANLIKLEKSNEVGRLKKRVSELIGLIIAH